MLEQDYGSQSVANRLLGKGVGDYGRAGYDRGGHSAEKTAGREGTPFSALMLAPEMDKRSYHLGAIQPRMLQDMDANGDGKLDEAEFKEGLQDTKFGEALTAGADDKDAVMSRLFSKLDGDGDGNLTPEEIAAGKATIVEQARLRLDTDQDGTVSREERMGFRAGYEAQADLDGNGELDRTERMAMRGEMMRALFNVQEEANSKTDMDEMLDFLTGKTDEDPFLTAA